MRTIEPIKQIRKLRKSRIEKRRRESWRRKKWKIPARWMKSRKRRIWLIRRLKVKTKTFKIQIERSLRVLKLKSRLRHRHSMNLKHSMSRRLRQTRQPRSRIRRRGRGTCPATRNRDWFRKWASRYQREQNRRTLSDSVCLCQLGGVGEYFSVSAESWPIILYKLRRPRRTKIPRTKEEKDSEWTKRIRNILYYWGGGRSLQQRRRRKTDDSFCEPITPFPETHGHHLHSHARGGLSLHSTSIASLAVVLSCYKSSI